MATDDDDLLALLEGIGAGTDEEEGGKEVYIPQIIKMSKGALDKAYAICDAVHTIDGKANEWFSFLLAQKKDPQFMVRDLLLVKGTHAGHAQVQVSGENHAKANVEVEKLNTLQGTDYYIIGWLHSHADFQPYHSTTDVNNFEQLLNTLYLNTQQKSKAPLRIVESTPTWQIDAGMGKIRITGTDTVDGFIEYAIPNEKKLEELLREYGFSANMKFPFTKGGRKGRKEKDISEFWRAIVDLAGLRTYEPLIQGFGYSIVVNEKRDTPYAEIGVVEEKGITGIGKKKITRTKTSVEVVEVEGDISFTTEGIEAEVRDRIVFAPKYIPKQFGKWRGRKGIVGKFLPRGEDEDAEVLELLDGRSASSQFGPTTAGNRIVGSSFHATHEEGSSGFDEEMGEDWGIRGSASIGVINDFARDSFGRQPYFGGYSARKTVRKEEPTLNLGELVDLFVYSAAGYVSRYRHSDVHYSEYMEELMMIVGKSYTGLGIREAVHRLGPLKEDGEEVRIPRLIENKEDWILPKMKENIQRSLKDKMREIELNLMYHFLSGDKNEALENYIPHLYPVEF